VAFRSAKVRLDVAVGCLKYTFFEELIMTSRLAIEYIQTQKTLYADNPEIAKYYTQIQELYSRKLWHQLTTTLEIFIKLPHFQQPAHREELIHLYQSFIKDFETRINQLKFIQMIVVISQQFAEKQQAIEFVSGIATKVAEQKEAYILIKSVLALYKLRVGEQNDCKEILDDLKNEIEAVTGIDSSVYEQYYFSCSEYYKVNGPPAEFYRSALLYLAYVQLEGLSETEKAAMAFNLGLAALVGENIYNFGELLAHPVLASLNGTNQEWMSALLQAFNRGDIAQYEALVATYHDQIQAQPALVANTQLLKEKIAILCLMELVFNRPSEQRNIPFFLISDATKLPISEVELLTMKALSLKLVKGVIDQVAQSVFFSWVQPRILNLQQVAVMKDRLKTWASTVHETRKLMEDETAELFR